MLTQRLTDCCSRYTVFNMNRCNYHQNRSHDVSLKAGALHYVLEDGLTQYTRLLKITAYYLNSGWANFVL